MRRTLIASICATALLTACTSAPAEKPDEATTEAAAPDPAAQRAAWAKDQEAALAVLAAMADGSKSYFESEQKITPADGGEEPWHDNGDETMYGYPVEWTKYVFPGGAGYTFTTHGEVPTGGAPAAMTLDTDAPEVAAALRKLNVTLPAESPFRYTYTTGSGGGEAASATIVAEADFDPSTPELHTITVEVSVDDMTQEVVIAPPVVTNEFD